MKTVSNLHSGAKRYNGKSAVRRAVNKLRRENYNTRPEIKRVYAHELPMHGMTHSNLFVVAIEVDLPYLEGPVVCYFSAWK
jgi:hypothetical protein